MEEREKRYRLRKDEKIMGYMREISGSMILYSKDSNWWTGQKLSYKHIDEWTGLRDKNGRTIYELDILYYKRDPDGEDFKGVVLWEKTKEHFGIRDIEEELFFPLEIDGLQMFNERQLKVFSYLFINPDLKEKLGIEE